VAFNGEAIQVSTEGLLLNGQHRLSAVIQSGVTVKMLIVWGVEPESFKTMDQGRVRKASDVLGMLGHKNSTRLAAVARCILNYEQFEEIDPTSRGLTNNAEIEGVVKRHPEIIHAVKTSKSSDSARRLPSYGWAIYYLACCANQIEAEKFFHAIVGDGSGLESNSAALYFRNWALSSKVVNGRNSRALAAYIVVHLWRKHLAGEKVKMVRAPDNFRDLLQVQGVDHAKFRNGDQLPLWSIDLSA